MSTHYTFSNVEESKALKASTGLERVHFKPMMETGRVIKGMKAQDAIAYLEAVMRKGRAVPFFRYKGGISHHAQGHEWGCPTSRWPVKCAELYIKLIKTALAGAPQKPGVNVDEVLVAHVQCNRATQYRWRRIHQAHGRVKSYASPPTNVQIVLAEKAAIKERSQ